ncbi:ABC transporter substrate-binding protein [Microbacterium sp.]|uniref:ABC transporter substrate-binding protein n=1 Tax=Microbacterium sp. TaxID=51671 RepID=UPI00322209E0
MTKRRLAAVASLALASAVVLAGCAGTPAADEATSEAPAEDYYPVTVTDLAGNEVTIESADSVAITDNRFFQLAADWDLPVTVAPRDLMSPNNPLADDEKILNIGTHGEPDFEKVVAADPDLIINGYRFSEENAQGMKDAAPEAAFVDMNAPDDVTVDDYVVESLTLMGEVFNKKDEAKALIDEFHDALKTAKDAYDPETTVMGLITSGGEINYSNPVDGRGASIFFSLLDLTPALDSEGSENHTGDSVSLEALAAANADVFMVLDRDAAVGEGEATPALELINSSAALATVPAVVNKAIYVFPGDYYLTEDVFAYIDVLNGLAKVFKA